MTIQEREEKFRRDIDAVPGYDQALKDEFYNYWSEPNRSGTKMRYEQERTWELNRRLKRWHDNNVKWNRNGKNNVNTGANQRPVPGAINSGFGKL